MLFEYQLRAHPRPKSQAGLLPERTKDVESRDLGPVSKGGGAAQQDSVLVHVGRRRLQLRQQLLRRDWDATRST